MSNVLTVFQSSYGEAISLALLHFLWMGAVLGLLAAISLRVLAGSRPQVRYGVACTFLCLMVAAPVLTGLWLMPADPTRGPHPGAVVAASTILSFTVGAGAERAWFLPVLLLWLTGVLVFGARAVGGWTLAASRFSHRAAACPEIQSAVQRIARQWHLRRTVRVYESVRTSVPSVFGAMRPMLIVPASMLTGMPTPQWEALLAHELAHIARHDFLINCLQSAVEVLLFYHPAIWWLSARIRQERELCCDAMAAELCGDRVLYARALVSLEETRQEQFALAASGGNLRARIEYLLRPAGPQSQSSSSAIAAVLCCGVLVSGIAVSAVRAQDRPKQAPRLLAQAASISEQQKKLNDEQAQKEHDRRVAYANSRFTVGSRLGSTTARGNVYILNGPPDEIESHPSEQREAWRYRDGRVFEFAGSNYELVTTNQTPVRPTTIGQLNVDRLVEPIRSTLRERLAPFAGQPYSNELMGQINQVVNEVSPGLFTTWRVDPVTRQASLDVSTEPPPPAAELQPNFPSTGEKRLKVGGNMMQTKLVYKPAPQYPAAAKAVRVSGTVRLGVLIGKDGRVKDVQVLRGDDLLINSAKQAVEQWVYQPTLLNGEPVEIVTMVDVNYTLQP